MIEAELRRSARRESSDGALSADDRRSRAEIAASRELPRAAANEPFVCCQEPSRAARPSPIPKDWRNQRLGRGGQGPVRAALKAAASDPQDQANDVDMTDKAAEKAALLAKMKALQSELSTLKSKPAPAPARACF